MPSDGDSFLPRIQSIFYSVFDTIQGPKIVYQVPEGLIGTQTGLQISTSSSNASFPPTPCPETPPPMLNSRNSSISIVSPLTDQRPNSRNLNPYYTSRRSSFSTRTLFNFDDISKYVIPHSALCGRLVICSTKRHRIIGFPVELGGKYERNYFRYNLCFVFERSADLSCYEPIVRKISRVLTSCEEESAFLSSPETSPTLHAIIEQLYEDLNSYSETSIPIDKFNSIELKILPFYPNPPAVKDWMVPIALINLTKRIEANWDLTIAKVCPFIDGTNHVSRIAHLADCDPGLTRQAISHLLYYQVIMIIDIFQYSNVYTLRKSIQWLADELHVQEECGPYVSKPGSELLDWPKLLYLYSRLKPGKTVFEWMQAHNVGELGIDVRRFTSFGVIKGFLRRVHRWPILLPEEPSKDASLEGTSALGRTRTTSFHVLYPSREEPAESTSLPPVEIPSIRMGKTQSLFRGRSSTIQNAFLDPDFPILATVTATPSSDAVFAAQTNHRSSVAEQILEKLRSKDIQKLAAIPGSRNSWAPRDDATQENVGTSRGYPDSRRHSIVTQAPPPSPANPKATLAPMPTRPRPSRSPSAPILQTVGSLPSYNPELLPLLDGEHHTDELATRFEAGWPLLERWLIEVGGADDGSFGRVSIIYR